MFETAVVMALIFSAFNLAFIYFIGRIVLGHDQEINFLAKEILRLTEFYLKDKE